MIEFNGSIIINGMLTCHGAGNVIDPFDRYDITVNFWRIWNELVRTNV